MPKPSITGTPKKTLKSSANSFLKGAEAHKTVLIRFPNFSRTLLKTNKSYTA